MAVSGEKRDKSYRLPGMERPSPEDIFVSALSSTQILTHSAPGADPQRDEYGQFISNLLDRLFIDDLNALSEYLEDLTAPTITGAAEAESERDESASGQLV